MTEEWMQRGLCREADPELFFPEPWDRHQAERAKSICRGCPVAKTCLEYVLVNPAYGIWGATTAKERQARGFRIHPDPLKFEPPCGTSGGYEKHKRRKQAACPDCLVWKHFDNLDQAARRNSA
jgi:WhiB family redox-sensing transcriptional regulator